MLADSGSVRTLPSTLTRISRLLVLLVPGSLMLVGTFRSEGQPQYLLWLGGVFQVLVFSFFLLSRRTQQPIGPAVTIVYLVGLAWLWMSEPAHDWFFHFAQFALLVTPLLLFALQMLIDTGALASRRARLLAERLASRKDWPAELIACRSLPEVKALREALGRDAAPALVMLQHPRPQVRMAALGALEFRKYWRSGQAQLVLRFARHTKEPLLRAAAISALANLDDRRVIEVVAEFLRDPSPEVRRAATEAILWDAEHRWTWIRQAVRLALAEPTLQTDGPLMSANTGLPPDAVTDVMAWATEKGCLGARAALTLAAHYRRALSEQAGSSLARSLRSEIDNPQAPPLLRIELAQLLRNTGDLDPELLERLVNSVNPGPLRLIAADALLAQDRPALGFNQRALAALHDIARLPNREMALTAADIVQRRLGVDLGLAMGQPLPPLHSRLAADVTRRLMRWAAQQEQITRKQESTAEQDEGTVEDSLPPDTPRQEEPKRDHGSGVFGVGSGVGG